jgi:hypothetical protein
MKQKIGTRFSGEDRPVSDRSVVFCALYNLIYEKLETEPHKGIVVAKGKPFQRKVPWDQVMLMAHAVEDFFIFRDQRTGGRECLLCEHWSSVSKASPHMGRCNRTGVELVHAYSSCKKFSLREEQHE